MAVLSCPPRTNSMMLMHKQYCIGDDDMGVGPPVDVGHGCGEDRGSGDDGLRYKDGFGDNVNCDERGFDLSSFRDHGNFDEDGFGENGLDLVGSDENGSCNRDTGGFGENGIGDRAASTSVARAASFRTSASPAATSTS